MDLPKKEGISPAPQVAREAYKRIVLQVSQATKLADLGKDYALFTHGLLFTHAKLAHDPIGSYVVENLGEVPVYLLLPKPMFTGMSPEWNQRLLAIPHVNWPKLYNHIAKCSALNRDNRQYMRMLIQKLPVPDVLALAQCAILPQPCPMVEVTTFGIDANTCRVAFVPALRPPLDLPKVKVYEPEMTTVAFAAALLQDQPFPFDAVDPLRGGLADFNGPQPRS